MMLLSFFICLYTVQQRPLQKLLLLLDIGVCEVFQLFCTNKLQGFVVTLQYRVKGCMHNNLSLYGELGTKQGQPYECRVHRAIDPDSSSIIVMG